MGLNITYFVLTKQHNTQHITNFLYIDFIYMVFDIINITYEDALFY